MLRKCAVVAEYPIEPVILSLSYLGGTSLDVVCNVTCFSRRVLPAGICRKVVRKPEKLLMKFRTELTLALV